MKAASGDSLSSLVWICTTTHNSSRVTIVDANNPADLLETFHVTSSHILCIASVHGRQTLRCIFCLIIGITSKYPHTLTFAQLMD